jgi:hypothetical protein
MNAIYPPKRRLTYNGLHDVVSQKTVLFVTTPVRTSNPAYFRFGHDHFIPRPLSFDIPSFVATSSELLTDSLCGHGKSTSVSSLLPNISMFSDCKNKLWWERFLILSDFLSIVYLSFIVFWWVRDGWVQTNWTRSPNLKKTTTRRFNDVTVQDTHHILDKSCVVL